MRDLKLDLLDILHSIADDAGVTVPVRSTDLAAPLRMSPSTVKTLLVRLEDTGEIVRHSRTRPGGTRYIITDEGATS